MVLVDYSSSSSADDDYGNSDKQRDGSLKRKRSSTATHARREPSSHTTLPPLPPAFHDLYASSARLTTHDDPALHAGRKRAVPHVDGNWPSHIYLESRGYPSPTEIAHLSRLIAAVDKHIPPKPLHGSLHSLLLTDLSTPRPLHISLSRPLSLETHQRDAFLTALTSAVCKPSIGYRRSRNGHMQDHPSHAQRIAPFLTRLGALGWAPNDSRTRWFLILRVVRPDGDQLNSLLRACNAVSGDFGLDELYTLQPNKTNGHQSEARRPASLQPLQPKVTDQSLPLDYTENFHVSIAWTLEEPPDAVSTENLATQHKENRTFKYISDEIEKIEMCFDAVKVKVGNEITSIALSDRIAADDKGILG